MLVVFGFLQIGTGACDSPAFRRRQLESVYPPDRASAAVKLAEAGDRDAVHKLVDLLDDEDAGVRLYVSLALERLCQRDYGYRYYDPPAARAAAVAKWRAALRDGSLTPMVPEMAASRAASEAADAPPAFKESAP